MGGTQSSFEEHLQEKISKVNSLKNENDLIFVRINNEIDRIINFIEQKGYNDKEKVCQMTGTVCKLYHFGIVCAKDMNKDINAAVKNEKVCSEIVEFHEKKIDLLKHIQRELPNCRNVEDRIYKVLTERLKEDDLDREEWAEIYQKLLTFNKEIKERYFLIEKEVERIRTSETMREIDGNVLTTNKILDKWNCQNFETDILSRKIQKIEKTKTPVHLYHTQIKPTKKATVKVTSDGVRRENGKIVFENPTRIEKTTYIHPSKIQSFSRTLPPGTKIVKVEPSYQKVSSSLPKGTMVTAISSHVPKTVNEIPLQKGQATTYLSPGSKNWAYVRHPDGQEGYVPATHLEV